jgi:transposase InsO family protein
MLLALLAHLLIDAFRARTTLIAELLFLRHENAVLRRRKGSRIELTNVDRWFLTRFFRLWPEVAKRSLLVSPATLLRWHRQGFRSYWRWKSRAKPGRPTIGRDVIALIKRIAHESVLWGAPRIHGELAKLGIEIAESTVAKYMPHHPRRHDGGQSWRTFLANEFEGVAAMDLMTVPTVAFDQLYALIVLSLKQRRLVFVTATNHPTAVWLAQQIRESFPWDTAPKILIRDNDKKYGNAFKRTVRAFGIRDRPTSPHSPWQNGYVERVIGTVRRECLDHALILNETHLRRLLSNFAGYYNANRTHLSLEKDAPDGRAIERDGEITSVRVLGGLHRVYGRCATTKDSNTR